MARLAKNSVVLWLAFVLVHAWLGYIGLTAPTLPWGDVTLVYNSWIQHAFSGYWVGINGPWVYPFFALVPMLAAMAFGSSLYGVGWFLLVTLANAAVFAFLVVTRTAKQSRSYGLRLVAAWWWLAFLLLLGPVSLGRIDSFTVALVIIGLLLTVKKPAVAGVLLALATWIKVWPAALIVALIIALKKRWMFAFAAAITGASVGVVGLILGAGANILSFITEQTGRGLQVEAPVSTVWVWMAYFRLPGSKVYYNNEILTFQVRGFGADLAEVITTPLLACVVLGILLLGNYVIRTGATVTHVLPPLILSLVTALIVFNKVGSPQFMLWLSAPIILGLIWQGRQFFVFAIMAAILAALTQLIYPYLYDWLLSLDPLMLTALTARNLLSCVFLGLAMNALWQKRKSSSLDYHDQGYSVDTGSAENSLLSK